MNFIMENIRKFTDIQNEFIDFIDNDDKDPQYTLFYNNLSKDNLIYEKSDLEIMLKFLLILSNYHHRSNFFYQKIENIIKYFKENIIQHFSSSEITMIFKKNKRMILFLYKEGMISNDDFVTESIKTNTTIFASNYIEQNYQSLFRKNIIFRELITKFNDLFFNEFVNLIEKYEILNLFAQEFSDDICSNYHYLSYVYEKIDFLDVFPKFLNFVDKEINKQIGTIIKYLFFIQNNMHFDKYSYYKLSLLYIRYCLSKKDKYIFYQFFDLKLKSYHYNKEIE